MRKVLSYDEIIKVPVAENGEPLLVIQNEIPDVICEYEKADMLLWTGQNMLLRKGAIQRLREAQKALRGKLPGARLRIVYAHRVRVSSYLYTAEIFRKTQSGTSCSTP